MTAGFVGAALVGAAQFYIPGAAKEANQNYW